MSDEALEKLMGSGGAYAAFKEIGTEYVGRLIDVDETQQTNIDGDLLFWDDGKPKMQFVITIDTGTIDPTIDGDDGVRRIYAKGQMLKAIREALRKHPGPVKGGTLGVKFVREGTPPKKGYNPPKEFEAKFVPPQPGVDALLAMGEASYEEPF